MQHPKSHLRPQAVAAVVAGEPASAVAKRLGLDTSTVYKWHREDGPRLPASQNGPISQRERTRELMAEAIYDTLIDIFSAVRAQLQTAARQEWLEKQSAGEIAALLGTELDRAVRLLAGFRPAEPEQPALEGPED